MAPGISPLKTATYASLGGGKEAAGRGTTQADATSATVVKAYLHRMPVRLDGMAPVGIHWSMTQDPEDLWVGKHRRIRRRGVD
jgi:hypothetical protein